jgi:hypothetical protein
MSKLKDAKQKLIEALESKEDSLRDDISVLNKIFKVYIKEMIKFSDEYEKVTVLKKDNANLVFENELLKEQLVSVLEAKDINRSFFAS